jgi:hypothetical protein
MELEALLKEKERLTKHKPIWFTFWNDKDVKKRPTK